MLIVFLN